MDIPHFMNFWSDEPVLCSPTGTLRPDQAACHHRVRDGTLSASWTAAVQLTDRCQTLKERQRTSLRCCACCTSEAQTTSKTSGGTDNTLCSAAKGRAGCRSGSER